MYAIGQICIKCMGVSVVARVNNRRVFKCCVSCSKHVESNMTNTWFNDVWTISLVSTALDVGKLSGVGTVCALYSSIWLVNHLPWLMRCGSNTVARCSGSWLRWTRRRGHPRHHYTPSITCQSCYFTHIYYRAYNSSILLVEICINYCTYQFIS